MGCRKLNNEMKNLIVPILIYISAISSIAIAPVKSDLSLGIVEIPNGVTIVVINSNDEHITIEPTEKTPQLSVGRYRIDYWTIERKDKDSNIWKLKGRKFGNKGVFHVIEGQEIKLSIGEPVISSLTASKHDSTYRLSHYLKGQLSETIEITKNGKRPEAPKLQIRNVDGSYQKTLTFEYG